MFQCITFIYQYIYYHALVNYCLSNALILGQRVFSNHQVIRNFVSLVNDPFVEITYF